MSEYYFLSVRYFPRDDQGRINANIRSFARVYFEFGALKRKLRFFRRSTYVLDYHIEKRIVSSRDANE